MIPDEAVEAARDAMKRFEVQCDPDGRFGWDAYARAALEAAAQLIAAPAWDEGYAHGYQHGKADCMKLHEGIEHA